MKRIYSLGVLFCVAMLIYSCEKEEEKPVVVVVPQVEEPQFDLVELTTSHGTMTLWLFDETPLHKANFLKLAGDGFYDGTTFHRVVKNFVAQGGDPNTKDSDPNNDGQGGPGYLIPAEIDASNPNLRHTRGAIGAARNNNPQKSSNGSQFYIVVAENTSTKNLDGNYTIFGRVIQNIEATNTIMQVQVGANDRPVSDIKMTMKIISKTKDEIKADYDFTIPE